jgi:hypothetical protein
MEPLVKMFKTGHCSFSDNTYFWDEFIFIAPLPSHIAKTKQKTFKHYDQMS